MGKGYGSTTIPVQAGIIYDLNRLYKKFKEKNSLRLTDFCECFREMGLSEIWKGRQSSAELIEFSEKLLQICATYMCSYRQNEAGGAGELIDHSLEERIFGTYCVYAFYFLQPTDYVTSIRITHEDFTDFGDFFKNKLVPSRHLDAACCLYKLIDAGAFRIVPFKNCYDPAFHRRYDVPDCEEIVTEFAEEPFSLVNEIANDPILKHIGFIQEKYDKMKATYLPNSKPAKNLCETFNEMVNREKRNFFDEKLRSKNLIEEDIEATNATIGKIEIGEAPYQSSSKSSIKQKAYKSGIQYNRNRRYADPNLPENLDDDVNEQNAFKKTNRRKSGENEDDESDASPLKRGRLPAAGTKRKNAGVGSKATKKSKNTEESNTEDPKLSLSVKEGRKRVAQKKAAAKELADAWASGRLPPIQDAEEVETVVPSTALGVLSDPLALKAQTTSKRAIEEDPEFKDLLKNYKETNQERKAISMLNQLTEEGATPSKPKPVRSRRKTKNEKE